MSDDTTPTPTPTAADETESTPIPTPPPRRVRIADVIAPPPPSLPVEHPRVPAPTPATPTPPVGAWRLVVDELEQLVGVEHRGAGCVAASLDGEEATAEAADIAVTQLARRLGRSGRRVVVLAPGAVRK